MVYVALLRGINVGGNNVIRMVALREAFEALGFSAVTTYIQSGNVVFEARSDKKPALTKKIEAALTKTFAYDSKVVLVSAKELSDVVAEAPRGFGSQPERYRYDVLFVKPPLTAHAALPEVPTAPGVDEVHAGAHALYFRRVAAKATKSRLARVVQLALYKSLTIRNWNTTRKLLAMTEA
ncbi:MAG: DUF1697 domain-containing protein [Labilithrix sp.]|nr:DUF1697 domain-containing protein [Labilithrix sp.]